ncbi:MAG: hypothetical protein COB39_13255 [Marinosulfonomonas sp.]|nr:MAG: hypothetical protein COB39_13255 [Marinosulfonomonas sp.]
MRELGRASDREDLSYIHQPSISDHEQNNDFNEWTALIVLTRDAWFAAADADPEMAKIEVKRWLGIHYPVFRRLAFFAAAQRPDLIDEGLALGSLLSDDHYWLWTSMTRRETIRLIASLSTHISSEQSDTLQAAITNGPPTQMFREDLNPEDLQRTKDRMQWLLLAKFRASGGVLNQEAQSVFDRLEAQYPAWHLAEDERDEFFIFHLLEINHRLPAGPLQRIS